MQQHQATLFADNFVLPEAPHWHKGRLWVHDVFDRRLYVLRSDGSRVHSASPRSGTCHCAQNCAPNVAFTNGGRTRVAADMWLHRLTAFDCAPDGVISNARVFAPLPGREPDGICADVQGAIWVACFKTGEVVRVLEGGEITDMVQCGGHATACELGGPDGRTLYCTAYGGTVDDMDSGKRLAAIYTARVPIPGSATVGATPLPARKAMARPQPAEWRLPRTTHTHQGA